MKMGSLMELSGVVWYGYKMDRDVGKMKCCMHGMDEEVEEMERWLRWLRLEGLRLNSLR